MKGTYKLTAESITFCLTLTVQSSKSDRMHIRQSFQSSRQGLNGLLKDAPALVIPQILSNTSEYHRHHMCRQTPRTSDSGDITLSPFDEHSLGLNYRSTSRYEKVASRLCP